MSRGISSKIAIVKSFELLSELWLRPQGVNNLYALCQEFRHLIPNSSKDYTSHEDPSLDSLCVELAKLLECAQKLKHSSTDQELSSFYTRFFESAFKEQAAPPVQSIYSIWTQDPDCKLSIARQKGHFNADCCLHMQALLQHYQIEIPTHLMADHLSVICALYALLLQHAHKAAILDFYHDHLTWLESFFERYNSCIIEAQDRADQSHNKAYNKLCARFYRQLYLSTASALERSLALQDNPALQDSPALNHKDE